MFDGLQPKEKPRRMPERFGSSPLWDALVAMAILLGWAFVAAVVGTSLWMLAKGAVELSAASKPGQVAITQLVPLKV